MFGLSGAGRHAWLVVVHVGIPSKAKSVTRPQYIQYQGGRSSTERFSAPARDSLAPRNGQARSVQDACHMSRTQSPRRKARGGPSSERLTGEARPSHESLDDGDKAKRRDAPLPTADGSPATHNQDSAATRLLRESTPHNKRAPDALSRSLKYMKARCIAQGSAPLPTMCPSEGVVNEGSTPDQCGRIGGSRLSALKLIQDKAKSGNEF